MSFLLTISLDLACTSSVACDFACVEPADCTWIVVICTDPNVPCRLHCDAREPSRRAIYNFGYDYNLPRGPCGLGDVGVCEATTICVPGVNCWFDKCADLGCEGGIPRLKTNAEGDQKCSCQCPPGRDAVMNTWGEATCIASDQDSTCTCLDASQVCVGGVCLCSGPKNGTSCENSARSNCLCASNLTG